MSSPETEIQEQLADLVERCKEVALMVGEGKEISAECAYCHGPVPLWEALFTQQVSGVLAHLSCPQEALGEKLGDAAPQPEFDYAAFVLAVEARMTLESSVARVGEIEVPRVKESGESTE